MNNTLIDASFELRRLWSDIATLQGYDDINQLAAFKLPDVFKWSR